MDKEQRARSSQDTHEARKPYCGELVLYKFVIRLLKQCGKAGQWDRRVSKHSCIYGETAQHKRLQAQTIGSQDSEDSNPAPPLLHCVISLKLLNFSLSFCKIRQ